MKNFCKIAPDKGTELFNKLKEQYGYKTAWKMWSVASTDSFKKGKHLRLDSEGFPFYEDVVNDKRVHEIIGDAAVIRGIEKKFPELNDSRENYSMLVNEASVYNDNPDNIKYVAIVNRDGSRLKVNVERRTPQNEAVANDQHSTQVLNDRLATELSAAGITIDNITEGERLAGRVGVTDFTKAKSLAGDVIRLADNMEGAEALGEEFSHTVIGAYRDDPLVQRALNVISNEEVLREILGDEYNDVHDFQEGDLNLVAEEALGKLLRENLMAQVKQSPEKAAPLLQRLYNSIKNKFKRVSADRVRQAVIDADSMAGQLAKNILKGQMRLTKEKISSAERAAQFNALSDRIKANIDILKKAKDTEIKRFRISRNSFSDEIQNIRERIVKLSKLSQEEKDTRVLLYNYAGQALNDLQEMEKEMSSKSITGTPSAASLRRVRSYIQSYAPFVLDMRKAIMEAKDDEEVPAFLTEIQLEDGTVVSMAGIINDLSNMIEDLTLRYNKYAEQLIFSFFRPFYGNDIEIKAGKFKGKRVPLEEVVAQAQSDISFMDTFLDTMADSSDLFLQLFDAAAKQANDNARHQTIDDSRTITRLRLIAEEHGIRNFDWMFEKDSKGRKTGNYISEYNIGLYQEKKQEFLDSLDAKYGKNAKGQEAKAKLNELRKWYRENADSDDHSMPKEIEKWLNKDYADAMSDPAKKELYDGFMGLKWKADNEYPDNRVSAYKAIQRRKSTGNRIIESIKDPTTLISNIKESIKETFLEAQDDDQMYGNKKSTLTNFDGTEYMTLPVLYTNRLSNPEELSTDIFADLLVYKYSANTYSEMDKIVDSLEIARNYVTDKQRPVLETRGGMPVMEKISALGEKVENKVIKGNSNIERKLNAWMESRVYGRHVKDEGVIHTPWGDLSKSKTGRYFLGMTSLAQLGFNFLAGFANIGTGIAMLNIEAVAGEYFKASDLATADRIYGSHLVSFMGEIGSRNKTNFIDLFDELFNVKAEFKENVNRNQKRNIIEKLFGKNIAFLAQTGGDHWLYNRAALAYCRKIKVLVPKIAKEVKRVKGHTAAVQAVDQILGNSDSMSLTADEKMYENTLTGNRYARVTTVINEGKEDKFSEAWKVPSTNIGTGIDELVRDFFSGLLVKTTDGKWHHDHDSRAVEEIYPNAKEEDLNAFLDQLVVLKEEFDKKGLTVASRDIIARGKIKIKDGDRIRDLSVAGTLDLLTYDKDGNFYIYDMKTHRGTIRNSTKHKWSMQLSMYKRLLEEEYGINIKGLNIIPIKVSYPVPEGEKAGEEFGHAKYTVKEGTNQLMVDGSDFKDAKPSLEQIIALSETKRLPIEYDNLGYNKQVAPVSDTSDYESMSLLEALKIVNVYSDRDDIKKMVLPEGTLDMDGVPVSLDKISRGIQDMAIHLFGAYNEEDSNVANMYVMGAALQQYRKWIKPQFNKRFQRAQISVLTDNTHEGYYRTYSKYVMNKYFYNIMNESLRGKIQMSANWNDLSDAEKANIKRARTELVQLLALLVLVKFIPWPDDKERPWALKFAEYMAQRELHELGGLVPSPIMLDELSKTIQSPLPAMTSVTRMLELAKSAMSPTDWIDEKQSGPYKGLSTLEANFLRAPLPGIAQFKQIDKFANELDTSIEFYARPSY